MFISVGKTFVWPKCLVSEIYDLENIGLANIWVVTSSDGLGQVRLYGSLGYVCICWCKKLSFLDI